MTRTEAEKIMDGVKRITNCRHGLDSRTHGCTEVSEFGEYVLADDVCAIFRNQLRKPEIAIDIERYSSISSINFVNSFYLNPDGKHMKYERVIGEIMALDMMLGAV